MTGEGEIVSVALKRDVKLAVASQSISYHRCEVRNRTFHAGIGPERLHRLEAISTKIDLGPRQNVFFEGDPVDFAFNVVRGTVKASKALPDGRRQITGFLYPGDFLGIALHHAHAYSAETLADVTLCRYPRSKLRSLFDDFPKLEIHLLSLTANELAAAQDQMLLLGRKSAKERVASFLLMLARRAKLLGNIERPLDLPMNRMDIADYLGLCVETVSRTFSALRDAGLIDFDFPTPVIIQQPELLEAIARGDGQHQKPHM